ncbi:septation protein A [Methylosarcina fibrata]|uniref:septation protein A n=1 Tax=Methylosarcina fibrata TaxID=105972 RepID=UPI00037A18AD|nr:septation protein A [Methylosarcina fibrata]
MNQFFEFFPILLFFLTYKFYDIYVATGVVIAATLVQVVYSWFRHKTIGVMQWITLALVIVMGSATIYLHDEQFIKWKLSIVEWLFGLVFLGSQFIGKKPVVERMLSGSLTLPAVIWKRLNLMWAIFFIGVGFINVYVMYNYTTDDWVTFKTFGVPGLMIMFILVQMALIYKHIPETKE